MGKVPYYPDSETDASSSAEITKKKKKFSILKYTKGSVKKKCKAHSLPEIEEPEYPTQNKKLRGILKHDITRDFSAAQELPPLAQDYIAQFLLNKELCCSETQIPEYKYEPKCEIIYDKSFSGIRMQESAGMVTEQGYSEESQTSFINYDDEPITDYVNIEESERSHDDDVDNIERCLMIGLVIGRALTCMNDKRRDECITRLSNYFNLHNYKQLTDCTDQDSTVYSASDEDLTDIDIPLPRAYPVGKCLVGRVPRPPGGRPGHCGGVAIIVRKNPQRSPGILRVQTSVSGAKARESMIKRLAQKKSY